MSLAMSIQGIVRTPSTLFAQQTCTSFQIIRTSSTPMQLKTKTFTILKIALNFESVEAFQIKNPALYSNKTMFYLLSYPYLRYSLRLNILLRYDLHYIKLNKKQGNILVRISYLLHFHVSVRGYL